MSDLPIWAQDKAREFLNDPDDCPHFPRESGPGKEIHYKANCPDCLAALLVEVEEQEHACGDHIKARLDEQMAEVRRIVEDAGKHRVYSDDLLKARDKALRDEILARLEKLRQRVEELERAVALLDQAATDYRKSRDAAEVRLTEWEAGAHADETGHLHLCAKVNGEWHCKPGCAKAEVERLRAALRGLVEATQNEMTARGLPFEWIEDSALGRALAALAPEVKR